MSVIERAKEQLALLPVFSVLFVCSVRKKLLFNFDAI